MKKIIFFLFAMITAVAVQSCKTIEDEDGDALINIRPYPSGIAGERALYQEISGYKRFQYNYDGRKLVEVISDSSQAKISYNADYLNKIEYSGFQKKDKLEYTQYFVYNANGKLTSISENRTITPAVVTDPVKKYKYLYDVKYNTAGKADTLVIRVGQDIANQPFKYTTYEKSVLTFDANDNVTKVVKSVGNVSTTGVFQPATLTTNVQFFEYDDKITPWTLLPRAYMIAESFRDQMANYRLSTNNPKRTSLTTSVAPIPVVSSTTYTYDPQNYTLTGHNWQYVYKPL